MKNVILTMTILLLCSAAARGNVAMSEEETTLAKAISDYFHTCFADLKGVAETQPTKDTFREAMQPVAEKTEGFFGGTLIDTEHVIRQVYFKKNFLARGFDLDKVDQLERFWKKMDQAPAPQLSEPARGNIMQPRLIAMRYPVVKDDKLVNIVSMMVRTEAFLEKTGLSERPAYSIVCDGIQSEQEGDLSDSPHTITLSLPSTEWIIKFD